MKKGVDYPGITVVYFCHDGAGNVLLGKRNQNARDEHGRWDIGGGGLDFGDTAEKTLRKEIAEEYLADVIDFEFLGYRDVFREHDGLKTHWIALDFKVRIASGSGGIGEPEKFEDVRWFPAHSLPQPLHSQLPLFLEKYKGTL